MGFKTLEVGNRFLCRTRKEYDLMIEFFTHYGYVWADGTNIRDFDAWDFVGKSPHLILIVKPFKLLFFTTTRPEETDEIVGNHIKWLKDKKYNKIKN